MLKEKKDSVHVLIDSIKRYISLSKDYTMLNLVEKLTVIFGSLILILTLIILGSGALFFALLALAYALAPFVGGIGISFLIITAISVILILVIYYNRQRWIMNPIVRFLSHLFFDEKEDHDENRS